MRLRDTFVLFLLLTSCNESSINEIFVTSKQENSIDSLLEQAQYEYDRGNFSKALSFAEKAYNKNPNNEASAVLLGHVYLAQAGLDTFSLAQNLISEGTSTASGDKTSNFFINTASAIGVSDEDLAALSTGSFGDSSLIYIPKTATDARNSESEVVVSLNKAISVLCPFIPEDVKLLSSELSDERHSATNCAPSSFDTQQTGQSIFAFALAHLGEAIVFYNVIFKTDEGNTSSNIEQEIANLSNLTSDPTAYATSITQISQVFSTSEDSMIDAMLLDLEATNQALSEAGVPSRVTNSVTKALTNVKEQVNGATNSDKLKQSLTSKVKEDLAEQITEVGATEGSDICESYKQITGAVNCP